MNQCGRPRRSGLRSAEPESPHETDPGLLHVDSVGSQGTAAPHSRAHRSTPTKEMYRRCIALVFFFASRCVRSSARRTRRLALLRWGAFARAARRARAEAQAAVRVQAEKVAQEAAHDRKDFAAGARILPRLLAKHGARACSRALAHWFRAAGLGWADSQRRSACLLLAGSKSVLRDKEMIHVLPRTRCEICTADVPRCAFREVRRGQYNPMHTTGQRLANLVY